MVNTGIEVLKRRNVYEEKYQDALYELYEAGNMTDFLKAITDVNVYRRRQVNGLYYRYTGIAASKFEWNNPLDADGVPIFARTSPSASKVNHKNHTAYDQKITVNKSSYIVGNPVKVEKDLFDVLKKTDFNTVLYELVQASTRAGNSFLELTQENGNVYFKKHNEWECISIYHPVTGDLVVSVRYYQKLDVKKGNLAIPTSTWIYEVFESNVVRKFEGNGQAFKELEEVPHDFDGVTLIEFPNNTERIGDVELTVSLQDAFDIADSDLSSEVSQLRLAYLALTATGLKVDNEFIEQTQQTGILLLDTEGKAEFLEKELNAEAVENLKKDLERRIYAFSNSYNPDELGTDGQMTAYQIRQKLFALENSANETIAQYQKSLRYLFSLLQGSLYEEDIDFVKNIPRNDLADIKMAVEAGFRISQKQLSRFVPLPIDQDQNEAELKEEQPEFPEIEAVMQREDQDEE